MSDDLDAAQSALLRLERDQLLLESDWTQLPDATGDTEAWQTYRQQLRDLPTHSNWPRLQESDWPSAPE